MPSPDSDILPWPAEAAAPAAAQDIPAAGSDIALDLHGDPTRARVVVFSDGNHHMALQETLSRFLKANPDAEDIFYVTTPPRILIEALRNGRLDTGNMTLAIRPHVFIGPGKVLESLHADGLVGPHRTFARSTGLSILVKKGNPKSIQAPFDPYGEGIRLAISNPVTEATSFNLYAIALKAFARALKGSDDGIEAFLHSDAVEKSQTIHHREIPQIIASGRADASVIYHHLALRYTRIFPDRFDLVPVPLSLIGEADSLYTTYHVSPVGDGGPYGAALIEHFLSDETASIYERHGLARPDRAPDLP